MNCCIGFFWCIGIWNDVPGRFEDLRLTSMVPNETRLLCWYFLSSLHFSVWLFKVWISLILSPAIWKRVTSFCYVFVDYVVHATNWVQQWSKPSEILWFRPCSTVSQKYIHVQRDFLNIVNQKSIYMHI